MQQIKGIHIDMHVCFHLCWQGPRDAVVLLKLRNLWSCAVASGENHHGDNRLAHAGQASTHKCIEQVQLEVHVQVYSASALPSTFRPPAVR